MAMRLKAIFILRGNHDPKIEQIQQRKISMHAYPDPPTQ